MRKIFKFIFSRFTLIIIALLIQISFYIFVPIVVGESFPSIPINLILSIIGLIVVVLIINSDMIIEGQLPLIILCTIAPILGIAICAMFITPKLPRKIKKHFEEIVREGRQLQALTDDDKCDLKNKLGDYYGQFNYIYNSTSMRSYTNSNAEFFSTGELFFKDLLENLSNAKKYIFMEYFIIEKGVMWNSIYKVLKEKAKSGIDVRIIYDDLGTMSKLPSNFYKKVRKDGIKCIRFNEFSRATSSLYNNRDHRKITVIDGNIGYVGGINLADEYINKVQPYGYWKDSAIKICGSAVNNLVCLFMQIYNIQMQVFESCDKYLCDKKVETDGVICPFGDGPKYLYGENIAENILLNLISNAKKSIYITTPYLIIDSKLKNALTLASDRGVRVVIVTPHIPDKKIVFSITRSSYKSLQEHGVEIYEFKEGFLHAKQILVDEKLAIVGTINMDYRSLLHHYECGVLMYNTKCLKDIKRDFDNILLTAVNMKGYRQNVLTRIACALIKAYTPLF